MRVKIKTKDGEEKTFRTEDDDMIMVMMSKVDKDRIMAMSPMHFTYCVFPKHVSSKEVEEFMKEEVEAYKKQQEKEVKKH